MSVTAFTPVFFLKQNCPFWLKLRIFLLEAGLLQTVTLREVVPGSGGESAICAELAAKAAVDLSTRPTYQSYVAGGFKNMQALYVDTFAI